MTGTPDKFAFRPLLFVDLDGTLVRTDTLWESLFGLLRISPFSILLLPFWLLRGRAAFKATIAGKFLPDAQSLPYNAAVISVIEQARAEGATIILATAAHRNVAERVAVHTDLFSEILATDADINLKSRAKAEAILRRTGGVPFDYIGNAAPDIPVWESAGRALIANPSPSFVAQISATMPTFALGDSHRSTVRSIFKVIRPHQWVKNLLLLFPPLLAHTFNRDIAIDSILAFISFCLCASGVYVLNDLFDAPSDRNHPTKSRRPFAAGDLPLWAGLLLFPVLFAGAGAVAFSLNTEFLTILGVYAVITTLYTFTVKRIALLDALTLASLYCLRLYAGAAATSVTVSEWLAIFSVFVFTSLAFVKRYIELLKTVPLAGTQLSGRGYSLKDAEIVAGFGITSGYLSVLVFCLYCYNNADITALYSRPDWLLVIGVLQLYWISRIWLLAHRGELDVDPILFTLRDPASYATGILTVIILFAAA
jgi:4-hydroxybenzoate polyprenyltransferase